MFTAAENHKYMYACVYNGVPGESTSLHSVVNLNRKLNLKIFENRQLGTSGNARKCIEAIVGAGKGAQLNTADLDDPNDAFLKKGKKQHR